MADNTPEGHKNGERYEGDFNNGIKEGKGKYFYKNDDNYDGDWVNGIKEG